MSKRIPKWLKVIAEYQKTKNVTKTAAKFNIKRGTVYVYLNRYKEKQNAKS